MKTHAQLISDINDYESKPGELALWWLGQFSFVVKTGKHILYLDPYLTPKASRLVQSLLDPKEITHATLITGSHDHSDHIDHPSLPALAQASNKAKLVFPGLLVPGL